MLLKIMNEKWSEQSIEDWFVDVHHFSLSQFKSPSPSLKAFVNYCDKERINGQNARTIERGLEVVKYVKKGISPPTAIRVAWQSYPLAPA